MQYSSSLYTVTGGARIGFVNYTWPFAKLEASAERLTVRTTLFGMGTYSFSRDQVISIERYGWIPIIGEGIRINHDVADYPEKIIFWCQSATVLAGISGVGFSPTHASSEKPAKLTPRGFPLRWTPLILLVISWNLLIAYDMLGKKPNAPLPGPFWLAALWIVFGISFAAFFAPRIQSLLLKPGRRFGEVKPMFGIIATVTGIMAIVFSMLFVWARMP